MSREFTARQDYTAGVDDVFALMVDEEFLVFLLDHSGGEEPAAEVEEWDDGSWSVTLTRALPAQVPSYLQPLVGGDRITVREVRDWEAPDEEGNRSGTLEVTFGSAPASITATLELAGRRGGSRLSVAGSVTASVPLIGGRIEEFARDQVLRFTAREEELVNEALEGAG